MSVKGKVKKLNKNRFPLKRKNFRLWKQEFTSQSLTNESMLKQ